jgi:hypothetical protein
MPDILKTGIEEIDLSLILEAEQGSNIFNFVGGFVGNVLESAI